jgi:hypothetical protein
MALRRGYDFCRLGCPLTRLQTHPLMQLQPFDAILKTIQKP